MALSFENSKLDIASSEFDPAQKAFLLGVLKEGCNGVHYRLFYESFRKLYPASLEDHNEKTADSMTVSVKRILDRIGKPVDFSDRFKRAVELVVSNSSINPLQNTPASWFYYSYNDEWLHRQTRDLSKPKENGLIYAPYKVHNFPRNGKHFQGYMESRVVSPDEFPLDPFFIPEQLFYVTPWDGRGNMQSFIDANPKQVPAHITPREWLGGKR